MGGGLRRAAVACVGRLCLAVWRVCRGAAQGVQALECRGAAGKSPCMEEWKSQRMGGKLNEVASGRNTRVRNRLQPLKFYDLGQNHSSAGQKLAPSSLPCLCPRLCSGLLGTPSLPVTLPQREGTELPPGST